MSKIILVVLVFSLALLQSFGQTQFGVKAGLNFANVDYNAPSAKNFRLGLNGGLLTEFRMSNKILVRPEILYSIKGYKFKSGGTISLNYVSIPILGGFRPNDKVAILLGPELSILTTASSKSKDGYHDLSRYYRNFDFAIDLGAIYNIKNGLGAELRYSYGFKDLSDVMMTDEFGRDIGKATIGRNLVLQIGLFYKFLKK